ncbi:uncharacterized protein V6R79_003270 [Siganus canaliculatus]
MKLSLWETQLSNGDTAHFSCLTAVRPKAPDHPDNDLDKYKDNITDLLREFEQRFQVFRELQNKYGFFRSPFTVKPSDMPADIQLKLIDLQCDSAMKDKFGIDQSMDDRVAFRSDQSMDDRVAFRSDQSMDDRVAFRSDQSMDDRVAFRSDQSMDDRVAFRSDQSMDDRVAFRSDQSMGDRVAFRCDQSMDDAIESDEEARSDQQSGNDFDDAQSVKTAQLHPDALKLKFCY